MHDLPAPIRHAWDTGSWLAVEEIRGGAVNRVFAVTTADGRFVLRRYRAGSPALLAREAAVTRAVQARGVPAVAALTARDGRDFAEADGGVFALFPFAAGVQRDASDLSAAQVAAAGAALGRLHRALAELPSGDRRAPRLSWDGAAWTERLVKVEGAILARPHLAPGDHMALARIRAQRDWLADPACPHIHDLAGPLQIIHGDYHHANLFFADGEVSAIIDWEQTALMPRAYEAVRAATYMFALESGPTRAFLDAWMAETNADPAELAAGAAAFAVVRDHWVWAIEEVYLAGNETARRFIPDAPFEPFAVTWARVQT